MDANQTINRLRGRKMPANTEHADALCNMAADRIELLRDTLIAAREYIDVVRRNHWPDAIPAANIIHDIDAALRQP